MTDEKSFEDHLAQLLGLARDYLQPAGWFESLRSGQAVDSQGPVPWITYPAIEVLKRIDARGKRVFEYGAGNSSLWWASRGAHVTSVECSGNWSQFISSPLHANNTVRVIEKDAPVKPSVADHLKSGFFRAGLDPEPHYAYGPSPSVMCRPYMAYAAAVLDYPSQHFDVLVIDGAARVLCAWLSSDRVKDDGFIVFDNTDRVVYQAGYQWLASQGFARIDFWGPSPLNCYESCTSIFCRSLAPFMPVNRSEQTPRPEHHWR